MYKNKENGALLLNRYMFILLPTKLAYIILALDWTESLQVSLRA